jgi:hypothetical protein
VDDNNKNYNTELITVETSVFVQAPDIGYQEVLEIPDNMNQNVNFKGEKTCHYVRIFVSANYILTNSCCFKINKRCG